MSAYGLVKLLHVLVAVLGLGLITSIALSARAPSGTSLEGLRRLARFASATLGLVLLSGGLLDFLVAGAYRPTGWFRLAGLSLLVTGATLGYAQRLLRRGLAGSLDATEARARVGRTAWLACALVGWIVVLMELRPFS